MKLVVLHSVTIALPRGTPMFGQVVDQVLGYISGPMDVAVGLSMDIYGYHILPKHIDII